MKVIPSKGNCGNVGHESKISLHNTLLNFPGQNFTAKSLTVNGPYSIIPAVIVLKISGSVLRKMVGLVK